MTINMTQQSRNRANDEDSRYSADRVRSEAWANLALVERTLPTWERPSTCQKPAVKVSLLRRLLSWVF